MQKSSKARRNGWKGQFPFFGKTGKGNYKNEKAQAKSAAEKT